MTDRRSFLSGLVTLPLIGGGLTLIGRAAATPVPLTHAAAAPILCDPRERARYAWEAFSAAMREITADAHGWRLQAAEALPFGYVPDNTFLRVQSMHYLRHTEPRAPNLIIEKVREIEL